MRLLLSLLLSAVAGAIAVVFISLWRGTSLGSPDFVGFMVVTVAVAWLAGVMLYAPMVFLLRRRHRARPLPAALFVGLLANLPLLLILLIPNQSR